MSGSYKDFFHIHTDTGTVWAMSEKEIIRLLRRLQEQVRKLGADVRSLQDGRPQGISELRGMLRRRGLNPYRENPVHHLLFPPTFSHEEKEQFYGLGDVVENYFTFSAMVEVALLFIGIFITMTPAICLLKAHGAETGVTQAWQFFWMSGGLSSFLDNAPTYATYFALGQGVTKGLLISSASLPVVPIASGPIGEEILMAISAGSVFMGANTYIGNAPNFMVKSICEEAKVNMPSFFGYMLYSCSILVPTFLLIMFIYLM